MARLSGTTLATFAMLAGMAALGLGAWAFVSEARSQDTLARVEAPAASATARALALLSRPTTQRLPLAGSEERVVLAATPDGRAVLVLDGLAPAPAGRAYKAWLIAATLKVTGAAAVFSGRERVVPLAGRVAPGAGVGVTLEPEGVPAPTRRIRLVARRPL